MRAQTRFSDAGRQFMPNHPAVKSAQTRIDQLTVACVVAAEQSWQQCQAKEAPRPKSSLLAKDLVSMKISRAVHLLGLPVISWMNSWRVFN